MNIVKIISCLFICFLLVGCTSSSQEEQIIEQLTKCIIEEKYDEIKDLSLNHPLELSIDDKIVSIKETINLMGKYEKTLEIKKQGDSYFIPLEYEKAIVTIQVSFYDKKYIQVILLQISRKNEIIMPESINEKEIVIKSGEYELPGTLTFPKNKTNCPLVIFVHGSGPCDRDESFYENKPFRDIAWGLAEKGIASYRYDKRTKVYASKMSMDKNIDIYDESIDDVVSALKEVKKLDNIDSSNIFILGHSLGGYIIPLIAQETPEVKGYIMMSAPNSDLLDLIIYQFQYLSKLDGKISDSEQNQIDIVKKQVQMIRNNEGENQLILGAYSHYWQFFMNYDSIKEAKKINKPVLVLQGEEDYQVPLSDFQRWKNEFQDKWTFYSYQGLTHFMMEGNLKQGQYSYLVPHNVREDVINDIIGFILNICDNS